MAANETSTVEKKLEELNHKVSFFLGEIEGLNEEIINTGTRTKRHNDISDKLDNALKEARQARDEYKAQNTLAIAEIAAANKKATGEMIERNRWN